MKKRNIFFLLLILISYLGLSSCFYIDTNITSTIKSNVYRGTLNSSGTLTTYFLKNKGDVPYVDFVDVTKSIIDRNITTSSKTDDEYKVLRSDNESYMIVNSEDDTIYFSNYEAFVSKNKNETTFSPKSNTYQYTNTNSKEAVEIYSKKFDLSKYNIDIVESRDVIYVPFQIYDTLIYSQLDISLAFNGHDYYYVSDSSHFMNKSYKNHYFNGRSQSGMRSNEMTQFTYNHLMFALDNFFGIKETRGIDNFSELCETEGLKDDLLNRSSETFNKALNNLIYTYLDDGHSTFVVSSNYLTYDASADAKYQDDYPGQRRKALKDEYDKLNAYRNLRRGISFVGNGMKDTYNVSGNTLIITIDSFNFPTVNYYDEEPSQRTYKSDSFAVMYYAFNKYIPSYEKAYNTKISNIVIDVTLNGGGYVDDCLGLLGFLSNNYYVEYQNSASKDISKTYFSVDTNLDGKFDDEDSYKGKYNFYILTSNYSFSCSNMLASVCKEQNLATIIGEETGGGGAIVYNLCLADSTSINISGAHSLIYYDNDNIKYAENKITPDYILDSSYFYTPSIINTFINSNNTQN